MPETLHVTLIAPEVPGLPRLGLWEDATRLAALPGVELHMIGGARATLDAIAATLRQPCDLVVWGGHGQGNRLLTADNRSVDGCWAATHARAAAPEAFIVAACFSARRDETLHSIAEEISTAGMHALAFGANVEDSAAGVYCVEFVRVMAAGADVVRANRVALAAAASQDVASALDLQFVPAVVNGYRRFETRIARVERIVALIARRVGVTEEELG